MAEEKTASAKLVDSVALTLTARVAMIVAMRVACWMGSRVVATVDEISKKSGRARVSRRADLSRASLSFGRTMSARSGTGLTSSGDGSCIPAMTAMRSERAGVRRSA